MKPVCRLCREKPAAAVVKECEHVCAECVAVHYEPEDLDVRWLDQSHERSGSLWLPKSFVLNRAIEKIEEEIGGLGKLEKDLGKLDYAIVGGTDGPGITLKRRGELSDRQAEAIMTFANPLTEGAGTHVTEALYRWLEEERP